MMITRAQRSNWTSKIKKGNDPMLLTRKRKTKFPQALQQVLVQKAQTTVFDYKYHPTFCADYQYRITTRSRSKVDFLCANISGGKKYLSGSYGDAFVEVESLRGKIICLYFASLEFAKEFPCIFKGFYNILKKRHPATFEMVFVAIPPRRKLDDPVGWQKWNATNNKLDDFLDVISTLPFPAVPFDEDWRANLYDLYLKNPTNTYTRQSNLVMTIIDTSDPYDVKLVMDSCKSTLLFYGPDLFPFGRASYLRVDEHIKGLAKETSITAILGSAGSHDDYLIDRHFNKVPISNLENKDVFLYAYTTHPNSFTQRLMDIYDESKRLQGANNSFEVVFINFNRLCYEYEKEFNDALSKMPWLALPFGHEKLWSLQRLMLDPKYDQESTWSLIQNNHPEVLFIKPKGKSFLDPYGHQVLHMYGPEVYPFTRQAAFLHLKNQLKCSGLTFESYVNQAHLLGLDFTSLVRRSTSGGTEEVLLSTIRERSKNIVLLFVSYIDVLDQEESDQCLQSFIDAYSRQKQKQKNKFEVIFVSVEPSCVDVELIYDEDDIPSFDDQISGMSWFSFHKQLTVQEHKDLNERTVKFDFTGLSHFIAFGPADDDLKIGLLPKSSLANCDFPFMNDADYTEDLRLGMALSKGWLKENWCVE